MSAYLLLTCRRENNPESTAPQPEPEPVVGQHLPMSSFEEAFGLLAEGEVCKVMFDISD